MKALVLTMPTTVTVIKMTVKILTVTNRNFTLALTLQILYKNTSKKPMKEHGI